MTSRNEMKNEMLLLGIHSIVPTKKLMYKNSTHNDYYSIEFINIDETGDKNVVDSTENVGLHINYNELYHDEILNVFDIELTDAEIVNLVENVDAYKTVSTLSSIIDNNKYRYEVHIDGKLLLVKDYELSHINHMEIELTKYRKLCE